jgi:hypothetical protein
MSIISILHMPIIPMLQQQTHMPFIIMQQEHDPPAIIMQRFFIISALVLSSQLHVILMPPGHFSIFIVQRGAMPIPMPIMLLMVGIIDCIPGIIPPIPIMPPIGIWPIMPPVIPRSIVIMFMVHSLVRERV